MLDQEKLPFLLEAILFAAGKPLTEGELLQLFAEEEKPSLEALREALATLQNSCQQRGVELIQVASGYRFQIKLEWAPWIMKLSEEKPARYSRALLETLALIAYRQPITRGDIEDIRGVSISTSIFKTLLEDRQWIRVVGHRDVPGRPALYATTKTFLDYFGLRNLQDLPSLPDILNMGEEQPVYDTSLPGPKQIAEELATEETLETETIG
jgi:segregation and condensation protein B